MKRITSFDLKDIVYFKKARFVIPPGVTFIQGQNLQRRGGQASNGSGKSLLFGVLPNMLFDAHPIVVKNARTVQKQIYGKGSSASVTIKTDKHVYNYIKTSSKVRLVRDGKDLDSRIARDQMKSLIDLSEEEFFSTVYHDSRRPNMFQMGSAADRYNYITNLFRLHDLDAFRKHVNSHISSLRGDTAVLDEARSELQSVLTRLKDVPKTVVEEARELGEWLDKASTRINRMSMLVLQWENYRKYEAATKTLEKLVQPKLSAEAIQKTITRLDRYEGQLDQWRDQQKSLKRVRDEFEALTVTDEQYDKYVKIRDSLDEVEKPTEPEITEADCAKYAKYKAEDVLKRYHRAQAQRDVAQTAIDDFKRELADHEQCPTCHGELSVKTKKMVLGQLQTVLDSHERDVAKYKRALPFIRAVAEWKAYHKELAAYTEYEARAAKIKKYDFKNALRYRKLKAELAAPVVEKPKPVEGVREELAADLKAWRAIESAESQVRALECDRPDQEADATLIKKLQAQISARRVELPKLQGIAAERKQLLRRRKELVERIAELEATVADLPVFQMLNEAYSTAGVKTILVQRIAKSLEMNLNRHSKSVFDEEFVFKFEVGEGQFNVLVSRKSKAGARDSDIRHMSGAESRLFTFLFLLALLPLIPDNRRLNLLILDEPDANMDPVTRETFRDRLVPSLAKVVPSLIVISPNSDIIPQHARVFTVVKNNGESKIVKGLQI